jgi:hypothetical protein
LVNEQASISNEQKPVSDPNKKVEVLYEVILPDKAIDLKKLLFQNAQQNLTEVIAPKKQFRPTTPQDQTIHYGVNELSESIDQTLETSEVPPKQPASVFSTFTHASSYSHVASMATPRSPMIWSTKKQPQIYLTPPIPTLERPIVYHNFTANTPNPAPLIINLPPDKKRATIFLARPAGYLQNNQFVRTFPRTPTSPSPSVRIPLQQTILASTDKSVPSIVIDRSFVENDGNLSPVELIGPTEK